MALQGTGSAVNGWSRPFYLTSGTNYPITLSAWIKIPAGSTAAAGFFGLCGANALAFFDFYGSALTGGLNDMILDLYDDTGLGGSSNGIPGRTVVAPSDGAWHHYGAQIITGVAPPPGGAAGRFWIDGVSVGNTSFGLNFGAQTFNTLQIGVAPSDGSEPLFPTNTALAEICVFANGPTAPLMDQTMVALAMGVNPLRTPGRKSLKAYHPLRSNFQDFGTQRVGFAPLGTPVAPVWVSHPPVDAPLVAFHRLPATHLAAALDDSAIVFGSVGSLTDPGGHVWTISAGQALQDGVAPAFTANVVLLTLVNGVVWITNTSQQWYAWLGGAWTAQFAGFPISQGGATGVLSSAVGLTGTGSSTDSATGVLLASSLQGRSQVTTNSGLGFLTSQTHFVGQSLSVDTGLGAFSTTSIPLVTGSATSSDGAIGSLTIPSIAANTQQMQNALIDSIMRGQPFLTPGVWYVALVTQLGDTITPGIEVTGGGYARVAVPASLTAWSGTQGPSTTAASTGISGLVSNNAPIQYPTASSDWATVVGYEFWDQPSGGNRWLSGKLGSALTIHSGDTRQFPTASLSIAIG